MTSPGSWAATGEHHGFVRSSTFWFQSFQNWQSEFVAVGSIVVVTILLR